MCATVCVAERSLERLAPNVGLGDRTHATRLDIKHSYPLNLPDSPFLGTPDSNPSTQEAEAGGSP